MFPPFFTEDAFEICRQTVKDLQEKKSFLKRVTKKSLERKNQGVMLGSLVCVDKDGTKIVLKAVSGISFQLVEKKKLKNHIVVPPIVSAKRIKRALSKNDRKIHSLTKKILILSDKLKKNCANSKKNQKFTEKRQIYSGLRKKLCMESLEKVFSLYEFHCANGKTKKLLEICNKNLPPTGTGDCCAPKLLDYAFKNSLKPLSMMEVFYDKKTDFYNLKPVYPCEERCSLILPEMLGLKIVYRDKNLVVVDKQSGILSVPGRGPEKQDSIVSRLKNLFPDCINQPSVHRLDMETSGLMVLAFDAETHRALNHQFENREVKKEYIAVLDGIILKKDFLQNERIKWFSEKSGIMELYFRLDVENRPHQIWDEENGKKSVTEFEILNFENYKNPQGKVQKATRIKFIPHTGRTHQLRLASSDIHGFNHQIIGDSLYGIFTEGQRLLLHSSYLSFVHPVSGKRMEFFLNPEF